jgi:hypothetical protein
MAKRVVFWRDLAFGVDCHGVPCPALNLMP